MRETIDLAASGRKGILDGDLDMFMSRVPGWLMVNHNVFVRGQRKPDVDREASAVMVLVTRGDHGHATSDKLMIVFFQPFDLTLNSGARNL